MYHIRIRTQTFVELENVGRFFIIIPAFLRLCMQLFICLLHANQGKTLLPSSRLATMYVVYARSES